MKRLQILIFILTSFHISSCQEKEDFSKTLQEYYAFGLPNIDEKWTYQDLENSISLLEKLKKLDSLPLPKLKSEKSSRYFGKILDELPRVDVKDSLNINNQFQTFNLFHKAITRLIFAYGVKEKEQIYYSDESIELEKLTIDEGTKTAQLYFNFIKKIPQDATGQLRKNSQKFQNGLFKVFEGSLEAHESYNKYAPIDKIELANSISENIKKIWLNMDISIRNKLHSRIQTISETNDIKEVRKIYSILLPELSIK